MFGKMLFLKSAFKLKKNLNADLSFGDEVVESALGDKHTGWFFVSFLNQQPQISY